MAVTEIYICKWTNVTQNFVITDVRTNIPTVTERRNYIPLDISAGCINIFMAVQQLRNQSAEKLHTSKTLDYWSYWIKQCFCLIASLFFLGTSLKGKNLLLEGANSFL